MQKNKKKEYTSPEMEVLNARVERGFDGSNVTSFSSGEGNEQVGNSGNSYNNELFN